MSIATSNISVQYGGDAFKLPTLSAEGSSVGLSQVKVQLVEVRKPRPLLTVDQVNQWMNTNSKKLNQSAKKSTHRLLGRDSV
jgi:hypothetical protein